LPEPDVEDIHQAGLLHDIGKIGVHDAVLQKEGNLTDAEFEHVKEHPVIGYRILKGMKRMKNVLPGVRHHHEDFAGTEYPDRLAGSEIPLMARILAVSDSYDAMRSDRPYRQGLPVERIEDIFRCGADQQWDPVIIEAYFRAREDIREIGNGGVADQSPDGE
jgi:HD-GYP domain-containing protein (c-di-GMP phosphodiesterase class II)